MSVRFERIVEVHPGVWKHDDVTAVMHAAVATMKSAQSACSCRSKPEAIGCFNCMALAECINMIGVR